MLGVKMNMLGNQSVSIMVYMIGLSMFLLVFFISTSFFIQILMIFGIIFTLFALLWINYIISYNHLQVFINRIKPNQQVWLRFTSDGMFIPQLVKKGPYGQTKGVMYKQKADVIDKGDFPIRLINGNSGLIVYDRISHNINLKHAASWKKLFKEYEVSSGIDAYKKAKADNMVD